MHIFYAKNYFNNYFSLSDVLLLLYKCFSKSSSNIVYSCNVVGKSTATKISIYLYLQEYKNGNWSNVDVVTKTATTRSAHVSDKFSSAVSGRRYRTEAHVYVYSGSKYEYLEANSATMIY